MLEMLGEAGELATVFSYRFGIGLKQQTLCWQKPH